MSKKRILERIEDFFCKRWKAIQGFFLTWKGTFKDWIIFLTLIFVLALISISFGVVLSAEAMKTLVQAEATFLVFLVLFSFMCLNNMMIS